MTRVLALTIRPREAADTRYRLLEYFPYLEKVGFEFVHKSLLSSEFYSRQQSGRLGLGDAVGFAAAVVKRAAGLLKNLNCDVVWVSRELMPYGPPLLEKLLFSSGLPVILDIDDALFEADPLGGRGHKKLRDFKKYEYIASRCRAVVAGNSYLAAYYAKLAGNVHLIPTCVDHLKYAAIDHLPDPDGRIRLGWLATPANVGHLDLVRGPIESLARRYDIEFRAVGLTKALPWAMPHIRSIPWRLPEEMEYLREFDIGLMPLADSLFTRGKCSFKLIQYMAAGVPAVVSPVGANCETLIDGEQGFLAETPEQWEEYLEKLILNENLRRKMGLSGRERVRTHYSLAAYWPKYADILRGDDAAKNKVGEYA